MKMVQEADGELDGAGRMHCLERACTRDANAVSSRRVCVDWFRPRVHLQTLTP